MGREKTGSGRIVRGLRRRAQRVSEHVAVVRKRATIRLLVGASVSERFDRIPVSFSSALQLAPKFIVLISESVNRVAICSGTLRA